MDTEALILAAGLSTRTPTYKLTLDLKGKTVIERCVEPFLMICSRVVIVASERIAELSQVFAANPQVELVYNPFYMEGMFSSVKEGVKYIRGTRFFITPGDYPLFSINTIETLIRVKGNIVVPLYQGRTGHPVLFRDRLIPEIQSLPYSFRLRDYIAFRGYTTIETHDPGVRIDIDTMNDYQRVLDLYDGGGHP
ncbi:MAG: nucleotidyltransferase family protein [Chitinophagales bacterium]